MLERRRAVALARHYREFEGLSIRQIAERLGRSPATVKAYFYDPTGGKARAVKARYVGVCRGCGAYTQPRNGKGDAYAYCNCAARRPVVSPAQLSMAIEFSPTAATNFPTGGHLFSPLVATNLPTNRSIDLWCVR